MALFPNFKAQINFIFWKYLVKFKFKEQRMKSSRIVGQRVVLIFKFILLFWQTSVSLMFWNSNYITVLSEIHNGLYCVDDHCERDQSDGQGHGAFVLLICYLWKKNERVFWPSGIMYLGNMCLQIKHVRFWVVVHKLG